MKLLNMNLKLLKCIMSTLQIILGGIQLKSYLVNISCIPQIYIFIHPHKLKQMISIWNQLQEVTFMFVIASRMDSKYFMEYGSSIDATLQQKIDTNDIVSCRMFTA